jgi:hypothetical protein
MKAIATAIYSSVIGHLLRPSAGPSFAPHWEQWGAAIRFDSNPQVPHLFRTGISPDYSTYTFGQQLTRVMGNRPVTVMEYSPVTTVASPDRFTGRSADLCRPDRLPKSL